MNYPGRISEAPECAACDQDAWMNDPDTDLSAAQPSVLYHVCNAKGPETDKQIFKAIKSIAATVCDKTLFPGTAEMARRELDGLLYRLAGGKIGNAKTCGSNRRSYRQ